MIHCFARGCGRMIHFEGTAQQTAKIERARETRELNETIKGVHE